MSGVLAEAKCDGPKCPVTTKDYMGSGWLTLEGSLARYGGRYDSGAAFVSGFMKSAAVALRFCSDRCLGRRMESDAKVAKKQGG